MTSRAGDHDPLSTLRALFDDADDAVLVTRAALVAEDDPSGAPVSSGLPVPMDGPPVIYANPAMGRLAGLPPRMLIGRGCLQLLDPITEPAALRRLMSGFIANKHTRIEVWTRRQDGAACPSRWELLPLRGPDGKLLYRIIIAKEMTEQRLTEQTLSDLKAAARRAGHDLNNIFTSLIVNLSMLNSTGFSETQRESCLLDALDSAREGSRTTRFLLNAMRDERVRELPEYEEPVAEDVDEDDEDEDEEDEEIEEDDEEIDEDDDGGDEDEDDDGADEDDDDEEVEEVDEDDEIEARELSGVSDTEGRADESRFDDEDAAFRRRPKPRVWEGLPRLSTSFDEGYPRGRLLLLDDDEKLLRMMAGFLEHSGYEVCATPDPKEAIALYREGMGDGRCFDLVILDLSIEERRQSLTTLEALQAIDPDVRAIAHSGHSYADVMIRPRAHGFLAAIGKPTPLADLAATIDALMRAAP